MNEAKLKQLLKIFEDSDIEELELQHSFWRGTRIRISRRRQEQSVPATPFPLPPSPPTPESTAETAATPAVEEEREEDLHLVTSPMVGTFYRSSSPETPPFVKEGDRVKVGQTLFLIEAMKIMNEIPADVEGEVVEVLAENATPVEFSQPLLKIRPS